MVSVIRKFEVCATSEGIILQPLASRSQTRPGRLLISYDGNKEQYTGDSTVQIESATATLDGHGLVGTTQTTIIYFKR